MRTLHEKDDFHSLGMLVIGKSSVAIMGMKDLADMLKTFELEGKDGKIRRATNRILKDMKGRRCWQ